jgi:hypothetical protein
MEGADDSETGGQNEVNTVRGGGGGLRTDRWLHERTNG